MTAGELIAELAKHNPETPVRVTVEDEFSCSPPADVYALDRVIGHGDPYLELYA